MSGPIVLDKDVRMVDEGHLPSIGAAAMAVSRSGAVPPPPARLVHPASRRSTVEEHQHQHQELWRLVVGRPPLAHLHTQLGLTPAA